MKPEKSSSPETISMKQAILFNVSSENIHLHVTYTCLKNLYRIIFIVSGVFIAMKSSSSNTLKVNSSLLLFFFVFLNSTVFSVSSDDISYADHCSSVLPVATPTAVEYNFNPYIAPATSYFTGGERILGNNSEKTFLFQTTQNVYRTNIPGVFKLVAYLSFNSPNLYYRSRSRSSSSLRNRNRTRQWGTVRFMLSGFWSESSEILCMVGSAPWISSEGNTLNLNAVLKLRYGSRNSSILESVISGKLESLSSSDDSTYFETISMLGFAQMNEYKYSLVSAEFNQTSILQNSSLSLQPGGICAMLSLESYSYFKLLNIGNSNCTPFNNCTSFMTLDTIQCSEQEQQIRYLIKFPNTTSSRFRSYSMNPNFSLVAEGLWNTKDNRLLISACRILNSIGNPQPRDCSIRMSLWYPLVWSITKSVRIEGQIWTDKSENDTDYFNKIKFHSIDFSRFRNQNPNPNLKYEYTQIEKATSFCTLQKKQKVDKYPSPQSSDMKFNVMTTNSIGKSAWGYAVPIFIGDDSFSEGVNMFISHSNKSSSNHQATNVSYRINFLHVWRTNRDASKASVLGVSSTSNGNVIITAEGIYNAETGQLCLVGCRDLEEDSPDCEILLNFQFPPVNSKSGKQIHGTIESTRKANDTLYFEKLKMSSTSIYARQMRRSIWRMDVEIVLVLVSNTLACVFVGLQLFHVKKKPLVLPFVSVTLVSTLTLGYMIPLLLNFEAILLGRPNKQNVLLQNGGWVEVNEVIVRVVTMVAFLLQFRLLQQVWTARSSDENGKSLWRAEIKALLLTLPLYIIVGFIALVSRYISSYQQYSLLGDLRAYAGLILDSFLFPQIILNMFISSTDTHILSRWFYIGTTFVRLLPHGYDLYRVHNYIPRHFNGSYIYANPSGDFYSKAWDVIIPCGGVLFAVVIFFQQLFGGRILVPWRLRELELYQKVPVTTSDE